MQKVVNETSPGAAPDDRRPVKKPRVNVEMRPDVRARLDRLVENSGADSVSEVVRDALAYYEAILTHQIRGGEVVFRYADGKERILFPSPQLPTSPTEKPA